MRLDPVHGQGASMPEGLLGHGSSAAGCVAGMWACTSFKNVQSTMMKMANMNRGVKIQGIPLCLLRILPLSRQSITLKVYTVFLPLLVHATSMSACHILEAASLQMLSLLSLGYLKNSCAVPCYQ